MASAGLCRSSPSTGFKSTATPEKLENQRKKGSSDSRALWPFWPVTETVGLAGDFVALQKLRRVVMVPVLHQHGLRELQPLQSADISKKGGS
jgi:hypothetical protein